MNTDVAGASPVEREVRPQSRDSVQLEITSCKKCPFMRADRHYTGDSFELCFDWKCTKNRDAIIANMDWNDKEPPIPKWCPLRPNVLVSECPEGIRST